MYMYAIVSTFMLLVCLFVDFQLVRCTLKILDVVYPKHQKLPERRRNSRIRSESISGSINGDVATSDISHPRNSSELPDVQRTNNDSIDIHSDETASVLKADHKCSMSSEAIEARIADATSTTVEPVNEASVAPSATASQDLPGAVPSEETKPCPTDSIGLDSNGNRDRNAVQVSDGIGCQVSSSGQTEAVEGSTEGARAEEDEYTQTLIEALFAALQDLLGEIITALSQVSGIPCLDAFPKMKEIV